MSTTKVKCENCGNWFEKSNGELNRCKKRGLRNFCNNSCSGTFRNKIMSTEYWKEQYKKHPVFKSTAGNKLDEFSPFRYFLNTGRGSMVKLKDDIHVNVNDLKELWEKQNGTCPYTGIKMILPKSTNDKIHSLKKASLDRIDSSLGYTKDNIEFVCMAINYAKNNRSSEEMKNFIKDIISAQTQTQSN
jgi:5-methylcytosine-specific restriction endonuclease McrA